MKCRRITITVSGEEEGDLDLALSEAVRLVKHGYVMGHDRNSTGAYYFNVESEVPAGEWPA